MKNSNLKHIMKIRNVAFETNWKVEFEVLKLLKVKMKKEFNIKKL